jgi:hypothetical protein
MEQPRREPLHVPEYSEVEAREYFSSSDGKAHSNIDRCRRFHLINGYTLARCSGGPGLDRLGRLDSPWSSDGFSEHAAWEHAACAGWGLAYRDALWEESPLDHDLILLYQDMVEPMMPS